MNQTKMKHDNTLAKSAVNESKMKHDNTLAKSAVNQTKMKHNNTLAKSAVTATGAANKENPGGQQLDMNQKNGAMPQETEQQQEPVAYHNYDGTLYRGPGLEVRSADSVPSSWENTYVRISQQHVWPFLKFFDSPADLDYGEMVYDIVSDNSEIMSTEEQSKRIWNDPKVHLWVEKGLVMKRNNVNGSICCQYKGTYCVLSASYDWVLGDLKVYNMIHLLLHFHIKSFVSSGTTENEAATGKRAAGWQWHRIQARTYTATNHGFEGCADDRRDED